MLSKMTIQVGYYIRPTLLLKLGIGTDKGEETGEKISLISISIRYIDVAGPGAGAAGVGNGTEGNGG